MLVSEHEEPIYSYDGVCSGITECPNKCTVFLVSEHPKYLKHEGQVLTNVYSAATDEPLLKRNGYL